MRLACLSCLLLLALTLPALTAETPAPDVYTLEAETIDLGEDFQTAVATGKAVLTYQNMVLHADRITANRATGVVTAEGYLSLAQGERRLKGDVLTFNMNTNQGALTHARVIEQGVIIYGEWIDFSPQQVVAHNAAFTTCPGMPPHYEITAERITLTAAAQTPPGQIPTGGRINLHRAHVIFRGRRLFTLPNYSMSVGQIQQRKQPLLPTTGFSRDDGVYTSLNYARTIPRLSLSANADLRLTSNRGVRVISEIRQTRGPRELYLGYMRRQDIGEVDVAADQITYSTANVMLNREPEVGMRITNLPLRKGLTLNGEVSAGRYTERDTFTRTILARENRLSATAVVSTAPRPLRQHLTLGYAFGLRQSFYSTDDAMTLGYFRVIAEHKINEDNDFSLSYIHRTSTGDSPFRFDAVEVASELRADLTRRINPAWRMQVVEWYDLENHQTKDIVLAATRTTDCLEYTLGWRKLRGSFFIGINLAPASPAALAEMDP